MRAMNPYRVEFEQDGSEWQNRVGDHPGPVSALREFYRIHGREGIKVVRMEVDRGLNQLGRQAREIRSQLAFAAASRSDNGQRIQVQFGGVR